MSMLPGQRVALSRAVAQHLHVRRRSVRHGQAATGQELGNVLSVFTVGLQAVAGQRASLRGIGQNELVDQPYIVSA